MRRAWSLASALGLLVMVAAGTWGCLTRSGNDSAASTSALVALGGAALTVMSADRVYVSAATIWEIATKAARGRLDTPPDFADRLLEFGMLPLALEWEHGRVAGSLPLHHRDPFDRMLVAQAIVERLTIVTRDQAIGLYAVPVLAA